MNRDLFIEELNNLGDQFPKVKSIYFENSDLGGTLETLEFMEGGEVQFYLTEECKDCYLINLLSYYTLSKLVHIVEKLNKVTHNIDLDRSSKILEIDCKDYYLMEFKPSRSKFNDPVWDEFKDIVRVLESNLYSLGYTYKGKIPRP